MPCSTIQREHSYRQAAISIKSENLSCGFLIVELKVSAALLLYAVIRICLQIRTGAKNIMANKLNSNNFFNGTTDGTDTPQHHIIIKKNM